MKQQLLLLEDVEGLGRSGDVVSAKPGFVRNFLLPQQKAVIADRRTLKMQARLKEEREKKAAIDRKSSEELAAKLKDVVLKTEVKTDVEGKMYGSVTTLDIARMLQEKGYDLDRKNIVLAHPLKSVGTHTIQLKLKEGVLASFTLEVEREGGPLPVKKVEEAPSEEKPEEAKEEQASE